MPQSARLSAGGGGSNGYLGNAQMNCYIFMVVLPLVSSNNQPVKIVKIWQFSIDIVGNVCVSDVFTWTFIVKKPQCTKSLGPNQPQNLKLRLCI